MAGAASASLNPRPKKLKTTQICKVGAIYPTGFAIYMYCERDALVLWR
jgi:hypothetical protein